MWGDGACTPPSRRWITPASLARVQPAKVVTRPAPTVFWFVTLWAQTSAFDVACSRAALPCRAVEASSPFSSPNEKPLRLGSTSPRHSSARPTGHTADPLLSVGPSAPDDSNAAVAVGGRQPLSSRSRTNCSRSAMQAASPPTAVTRVLLTLPMTMAAAGHAPPSADAEHWHRPVERLLPFDLTDRCQP